MKIDGTTEFISHRTKDDTITGEVQGVIIHVDKNEVEIMTENFPTRKWDAIRIPRSIWDQGISKNNDCSS